MARDLVRTSDELQAAFGWPDPFHDPGVSEFGLENAVFEVGDTFVEVVSPIRPDTTAGRLLERRGADGGYMAIFQVPDLAAARRHVAELQVRTVWSVDLADMATSHLHPKDVPGAIVSLDWASPEGSWRWAGPRWAGTVPATHAAGGVVAITVSVPEPERAAHTWAQVLDGSLCEGSEVVLASAHQCVRFSPSTGDSVGGITHVAIAGLRASAPVVIAGVTFTSEEIR